jgi:hypothetical protein
MFLFVLNWILLVRETSVKQQEIIFNKPENYFLKQHLVRKLLAHWLVLSNKQV